MKTEAVTILCPDTEFSTPFVAGMAARMTTSFHKYGAVKDAYPRKINAIVSLLVRLMNYLGENAFRTAFVQATAQYSKAGHRRRAGNTEYLMDAANFAMIEFMFPSIEGAHFEALDSNASPGRSVVSTGQLSAVGNTPEADNIRLGGTRGRTAGGFYAREGD